MKGLVVTSKGIEDIAALEVQDLIKAKTSVEDSCVLFDFKKLEELCLLCYKGQSVEKVLFLLDSFEFKDDIMVKLTKVIAKVKFSDWLDKTTTFRVSCKKRNNEELFSEELAGDVGALIIKQIKKDKKYKQPVELDNPDITFFVFVNGLKAYFGIDFSGRDLYKREYKLFAHPAALRSTIAYSLLRIGGFSGKEVLLDPFCHSGEIPIEAALFATKFPVNYYSKEKFSFLKFKPFKKFDFEKFFKGIDKNITKKADIHCFDESVTNLNAAKKNAKIAGVNKVLSFSRMDMEGLDIKMDKGKVDLIITHPPELTRMTNPKTLEKEYDKFFYQAEFILRKKGQVVVVTKSEEMLKVAALKYGFKAVNSREVWSGQLGLFVLVFGR